MSALVEFVGNLVVFLHLGLLVGYVTRWHEHAEVVLALAGAAILVAIGLTTGGTSTVGNAVLSVGMLGALVGYIPGFSAGKWAYRSHRGASA